MACSLPLAILEISKNECDTNYLFPGCQKSLAMFDRIYVAEKKKINEKLLPKTYSSLKTASLPRTVGLMKLAIVHNSSNEFCITVPEKS